MKNCGLLCLPGKAITGLLLCFWAPLVGLSQSRIDFFQGIWLTKNNSIEIEIYEEDGKYQGEIISDKYPLTKQGKNKIGLLMLKDFVLVNDRLVNGKMIDPDSNKEYKCILQVEDANTLRLKVCNGLISEKMFKVK